MKSISFVFAGLLLAASPSAFAQSAVNLFGTIEKIEAGSIVVKNDDGGATQTFRLAPNYLVLQNKPAKLADIKPTDYVASAAVRKEDGKLHSTELRIFPEAFRGQGEGQRPMGDGRQTMTTATVTGTAIVNGSNNLKVKFETGESELVLDPGVPLTRIDTVDKSLLKQGAKVRVQGATSADGATANRITLQ